MPTAKFLTAAEVCAKCRFSRTTLRRSVAAGTFPKPYRVSKQRVVWKESDVDAWVEDRREANGNGKDHVARRRRA